MMGRPSPLEGVGSTKSAGGANPFVRGSKSSASPESSLESPLSLDDKNTPVKHKGEATMNPQDGGVLSTPLSSEESSRFATIENDESCEVSSTPDTARSSPEPSSPPSDSENENQIASIPAPPQKRSSFGQPPQNGLSSDRRRRHKSRKRCRNSSARASVYELDQNEAGVELPSNQFECVLYRRSTRRSQNAAETENSELVDAESFGDVSLGMNLTINGGKVVVRRVNALKDGRASPAQLTGRIRGGDVLLSINEASLVSLSEEELMIQLRVLGTPDRQGIFQRELKLRFAAGEGLSLLAKSELPRQSDGQATIDAANDMFTMFVDQLSGRPIVPEGMLPLSDSPQPRDIPTSPISKQKSAMGMEARTATKSRRTVKLDDSISADIAMERTRERELFDSEFFSWSDASCVLLKSSPAVNVAFGGAPLTLNQLIERGRRAVVGAAALSASAERLDKGDDLRSFKSWNTTLSLYSGANVRRQQILDGASLPPMTIGPVEEGSEDANSDAAEHSHISGDDHLNGDDLLLHFAAHDEIWRRQVLESLKTFVQKENNGNFELQESSEKSDGDADSALSNELGNFLFGENVAKILKKRRRSQALPPEEITAVLFDLTSKIAATIPDEFTSTSVTAAGSRSTLTPFPGPFSGTKRQPPGSDVALATQFLLNEALPIWLKSFRPLPHEQRKLLWPLERRPQFGSTAASSVSDDNLSLDSVTTGQVSVLSVSSQRTRKNLREIIEEKELNTKTRKDTNFLTTYYFTQKLLSQLRRFPDGDARRSSIEGMVHNFIYEYGSYLSLHTCLAYSATLKARGVIEQLLEISQFDSWHRSAMKQTSKTSAMVFYEPSMLSAVLQRLAEMHTSSTDRKLSTIDLCSSAYPDVLPWQVRDQCLRHESVSDAPQETKNELDDVYYLYLCRLLHPVQGEEAARRDCELVKEWCELSVRQKEHGTFGGSTLDRMKNFLLVASTSTSHYLAYQRDLVHILDLSLEAAQFDLAIDLAGEIFQDAVLMKDESSVSGVVITLRTLGLGALGLVDDKSSSAAHRLRRVLKVYRIGQDSHSQTIKQLLDVPTELLGWIRLQFSFPEESYNRTMELLRFLSQEAMPGDFLTATKMWMQRSRLDLRLELLPFMHTALSRASAQAVSGELSSALRSMKLSQHRLRPVAPQGAVSCSEIWTSMSAGTAPVDK